MIKGRTIPGLPGWTEYTISDNERDLITVERSTNGVSILGMESNAWIPLNRIDDLITVLNLVKEDGNPTG